MTPLVTCPSCQARNRVDPMRAASPVCGRCRASLPAGVPAVLDSASFDAFVSRTDRPVLVDFWAPWCAPCRMMAPGLAKLALTRTDLAIAKLDTEKHPDLAARFSITAIPTLILFSKGRPGKRHSGALSPYQLDQLVSGWLANYK